MKLFTALLLSVFICNSCTILHPKHFSKNALEETLYTTNRETTNLTKVLQEYKGEKVLIQLYASYCPVSQSSFYDVADLQKEIPFKNYIFLSVDHSYHDWKRGLEKLKVTGKHFYIPKKGKGALANFLKLKSIPRFLLINSNGSIRVFNQASISKKIKRLLKK